jgi:major membrane immunogen (membrane-anchored lipoprotein)
MKKIVILVVMFIVGILMLVGCGNRSIFDTTYTFDHAVISLPDGTIVKGKVQSWMDYEDGDQIQVEIDGAVYLVHSEDCALIAE